MKRRSRVRSRIFLSYARSDDKSFVRRLYTRLSETFDVWFDLENMPSRSLSFLEEIRRAIDGCERVVVVIGPAAVRSEYVRAEWLYGMARDKPVVPILRAGRNARKPAAKDYETLPAEMKNLHTLDFRTGRPFGKACAQLIRLLQQEVPAPGPVRTTMQELPPTSNRGRQN